MTTELDQEIAKIKAELSTVGSKFAKDMKRETGMDLPEVFVHIATGLYLSRRMWRAAKRGDTAMTIAWAVTVLSSHANQRDKIRKHQMQRDAQKRSFAGLN